MKKIIFLFLATSILACKHDDLAPSSGTPGPPYFSKVKSIIAYNCMGCHSSSGSWSGRPTKFDTDDDIVAAAASIKTAVAGPWTFIVKQMPQGGSLSQQDINTIVAWVNAGGQANN